MNATGRMADIGILAANFFKLIDYPENTVSMK
jgi:hypothetical protein